MRRITGGHFILAKSNEGDILIPIRNEHPNQEERILYKKKQRSRTWLADATAGLPNVFGPCVLLPAS